MCGPLPSILFKILPSVYAHRLVERGEMMWSTLAWFQNEEDPARGDQFDATRRHFPTGGLQVKRIERDGRPDGAQFTMPSHGNQWRPIQSKHIFIYSTTLDQYLVLGDPAANTCVEIFDPAQLIRRVRTTLELHRKARPDTLIHDAVRYWCADAPPAEVWALPHRLAMQKHHDHAAQQEYRFAFGPARTYLISNTSTAAFSALTLFLHVNGSTLKAIV
jgi:hypothetical protein